MAFNVKKYKFRVQQRSGTSYGKMGKVGLVGQRSIVVNGKKVKAGVSVKIGKANQQAAIKTTKFRRKNEVKVTKAGNVKVGGVTQKKLKK